jgi:hypothetical protein
MLANQATYVLQRALRWEGEVDADPLVDQSLLAFWIGSHSL